MLLLLQRNYYAIVKQRVLREAVCVRAAEGRKSAWSLVTVPTFENGAGVSARVSCCRTSCSEMQLNAEMNIHANWYKLNLSYQSSLAY